MGSSDSSSGTSQEASAPSGLGPELQPEIDRLVGEAWKRVASSSRPLLSTYRMQLQPGVMSFTDAARWVPYLAALGVSHLYLSPHLKCRRGSTHGYDVVDHGSINDELGSEEDLSRLHDTLRQSSMGALIDWVPNHMAIGKENPAWMDVLENGPSARSAPYFDIDWSPVKTALNGKVLYPVLGDQYGVILERGELKIGHEQGAFSVGYWEHRFPVTPRSYALLLGWELEGLVRRLGADNPEVVELLSILTAIRNLPEQSESNPERQEERQREKEVIKKRLASLYAASSEIRSHVDAAVDWMNGGSAGFEQLHELLEQQCYRLSHWRVAGEEINYRRFFDVNELVAIRMEDASVFEPAHELLYEWVASGWVQSLRIDHPDGLYDPGEYFRRLQTGTLLAHCRAACQEHPAPVPWEELEPRVRERCRSEILGAPRPSGLPLFVVVEKILGRKERLPDSWSVSGTTGYDFLNTVNAVLIDREGARGLDNAYTRFLGRKPDYAARIYASKKLTLKTALASELQLLAHRLDRISESDPRTRDFTLGTLERALAEVIACFPVYRTYIAPEGGDIDSRDRQYVQMAVNQARKRSPATAGSVFDFIQAVLLQSRTSPTAREPAGEQLAFPGRFQQLPGPAMAKGMEDTTFYIFNRLLSLNEVGGEPDRVGITPAEFHAQNRERLARAPGSLLSTTTHDTKRSEDVRVRIDALSEIPDDWLEHAIRWARLNRRSKSVVGGSPAPDRNDEYFLYQTLVGAWPDITPAVDGLTTFQGRIESYLTKAAREAKVHTSWIDPQPEYENALLGFARALFARPMDHPFWQSFLELHRLVAWAGRQASLAQLVLKEASPGIPDIYQGSELWDLRLVDPDNRAPVDFRRRSAMLDSLIKRAYEVGMEQLARELAVTAPDGRIKLYVTWRGLTLRRTLVDVFTDGDYQPLSAVGDRADHVLAFARTVPGSAVIAVAGRHFLRLARACRQPDGVFAAGEPWWARTSLVLPQSLAGCRFRDRFTERIYEPRVSAELPVLDMQSVFAILPVALLEQLPG